MRIHFPFPTIVRQASTEGSRTAGLFMSSVLAFATVVAVVVFSRLILGNSIPTGGGVLAVLAFSAGCAFLALALRVSGIRDAVAIAIVLSLLPVAFTHSAAPSVQLWAFSLAFASTYFLTTGRTMVGGVLVALAASCDVSTVLILILPVLFLESHWTKEERAGFFRMQGVLVVSCVLVRIAGEFLLHGAVSTGLTIQRPSVDRLFRILTVEAYGILSLIAFACILVSLVLPGFRKRTPGVWWYGAGAAVSFPGALVLNPGSNLLIVAALFLLLISANIHARLVSRSLLILVAASPFFFMVTRIPFETTIYSNVSTTVEVRGRRFSIDALQGPVLFERAKRAARKETTESGSGALAGVAGTGQQGNATMWLTGYYPVWSIGGTNGGINNPMYPHEMNWQGLTHVVHFNVGPDSTAPYWHPSTSHTMGTANTDSMEMFYGYGWRFNTSYLMIDSLRTFARANHVKLLLSVGGIWGGQASAMDHITRDSSRTQTFVNAAVGFASRNGYDGIEIDWEPPASEQQMSMLTRIMKRRMTLLLGNKAPLVLAACFECGGAYGPELQDSIAQYNFMMYDMHQPFNGISGGGPADPLDVTGFNAPLFPPDGERYPVLGHWGYNYDGTRGGIPSAISPRKFLRMGFPPSKVGIGVPFYGYIYPGKSVPNEPRNGVWPQYLSYMDCIRALRVGGTRNWEEKARVPWISGTAKLDIGWMVKSGQEFYITYDDSASLREKVLWAKRLGLGGIMVYELWTGWLSSEPQGRKDPLLRSVVEAMGEKER